LRLNSEVKVSIFVLGIKVDRKVLGTKDVTMYLPKMVLHVISFDENAGHVG